MPKSKKNRFSGDKFISGDSENYFDRDGNYIYTYKVPLSDGTTVTRKEIIKREDLSPEIFEYLYKNDEDTRKAYKYDEENMDYGFINTKSKYSTSECGYREDNYKDNPDDCIADPDADVFEKAFPEIGKNFIELSGCRISLDEVRKWISTLTESQQNLIFAHFGERKMYEEIRLEEIQSTGKNITKQAINNRLNKIIKNGLKYFGLNSD